MHAFSMQSKRVVQKNHENIFDSRKQAPFINATTHDWRASSRRGISSCDSNGPYRRCLEDVAQVADVSNVTQDTAEKANEILETQGAAEVADNTAGGGVEVRVDGIEGGSLLKHGKGLADGSEGAAGQVARLEEAQELVGQRNTTEATLNLFYVSARPCHLISLESYLAELAAEESLQLDLDLGRRDVVLKAADDAADLVDERAGDWSLVSFRTSLALLHCAHQWGR